MYSSTLKVSRAGLTCLLWVGTFNFIMMVLSAQTELEAFLWICFTPKYMLLIFSGKYFFWFFFADFFRKKNLFFFWKFRFQKKVGNFSKNRGNFAIEIFSDKKIFGEKKIGNFFLEKNQKYKVYSKTYPKESF